MEWIKLLRQAMDYMETHLLDDVTQEDVARSVNCSGLYFNRGFKIVTGYSPAEYMRNRRLYLAALDALGETEKVIDIVYRYGYETPESFSKAFCRFHGVTPTQLRTRPDQLHVFLPLRIRITVDGGEKMDYRMEEMQAFQVIGLKRDFESHTAYGALPAFWDEFWAKLCKPYLAWGEGGRFWKYGICMEDEQRENGFTYLIAGDYNGGPVPPGLTVETIPAQTWAKFRCVGPLPGAVQAINSQIFQEWLPGNAEFELAGSINLEWYGPGDHNGAHYLSEIWIPVRAAEGR